MHRQLTAHGERWPLTRPFRIARGEKVAAEVIVAEIRADGVVGSGEALPYARYGESVDSTLAQIRSVSDAVCKGAGRGDLAGLLPAGAARNAVDAAMWDLEARTRGATVAQLIGEPEPEALVCAMTISLAEPSAMAAAAAAVADAPLIKIKVDASRPQAAVAAVRHAAPAARLIVDPNESWTPELLVSVLPEMADLDVDLIEQPLSAEDDAALEGLSPEVPICADESAHVRADLPDVARRYQAVNIKLDKTGGLTEALAMRDEVRRLGLRLMVGCMVTTSLGIAPALHVAQGADFADLDGPWWLADDRLDRVGFEGGRILPPASGWGRAVATV